MRINMEDCDVPLPSVDDVTHEVELIPELIRENYLPYSLSTFAQLWVELVTMSIVLGDALRTHYRHAGPHPTVEETQRCEEDLHQCAITEEACAHQSPGLQVFVYQMQLFYEYGSLRCHYGQRAEW